MYSICILILIILISSCTNRVNRVDTCATIPLEKVNDHLQRTYKLNIKRAVLTGEVVKEPTCNLNKTYTVIKFEY